MVTFYISGRAKKRHKPCIQAEIRPVNEGMHEICPTGDGSEGMNEGGVAPSSPLIENESEPRNSMEPQTQSEIPYFYAPDCQVCIRSFRLSQINLQNLFFSIFISLTLIEHIYPYFDTACGNEKRIIWIWMSQSQAIQILLINFIISFIVKWSHQSIWWTIILIIFFNRQNFVQCSSEAVLEFWDQWA